MFTERIGAFVKLPIAKFVIAVRRSFGETMRPLPSKMPIGNSTRGE